MQRKIIKIDTEKCNGCGACAVACHEGAIEMIRGKAVLTREDYCDGLGDCLPTCPVNAIRFEYREAPAYNEEAVRAAQQKKIMRTVPHSCPGAQSRLLHRDKSSTNANTTVSAPSRLSQWPCQIKLVPVNAPYFDNAELLIAADCTAYAYASFHEDFIRNRITLIGCPKLDAGDYAEKLTHILQNNNIKGIMVARMEVPCCGGLERAVVEALRASQKDIPLRIATISTDGKVLSEK